MKTNTRYRLTPQMKEYDKIGTTWLPYLMYFHAPDYSSRVLNTDSRGFRVTYKNSERIGDFKNIEKLPVCLLAGGSFAFGVGATNDGETIPSILNSMTHYLWLNFSGRAFSSTQELLLFLFHQAEIKNIKKIVILSGVNNLILHYLSREYRKEIGSFYFSNRYNRRMNSSSMSLKRKIVGAFFRPFLGDNMDYSRVSKEELLEHVFDRGKRQNIRCENNPRREKSGYNAPREDLLHVLKRDISNWKMIREYHGIELHYVLQPFANWIEKKLSREEEELFAELDKHPHNQWKILRDKMNLEQYAWFLEKVRNICEFNGIRFFDMNRAISAKRLDGKWLYVDRAHFTNEGYRIAAEILRDEVIKK